MKIAICDDCLEDIKYLEKLITASEFSSKDIVFLEYVSGETLLESILDFDAIFLDMQLEGMDGKRTAEHIRKRDSEVLISFYSGFETSANQILRSRPYSYLMKNSAEKELSLEVDRILCELLERKRTPGVSVACDGQVFVLKTSDILYISIYNKGSKVWITDEKAEEIWCSDRKGNENTIRSTVKLDEYYQRLKDYGFIYASKSYIVNAEKVAARRDQYVVLNGGHQLNVSRSRTREFDDEFGRYLGMSYGRRKAKK